MRIIFILSLVAIGINVNAQPLLLDVSDRPGEAFTADVFYGTIAGAPGDSGANKTWDFSNAVSGATAKFVVLNTLNNKYKNNYPTAQYVYIIDSLYNYFNVSTSMMEMLTKDISAPGGSNDYSQNPKKILEFPFSFLMSFTDTWRGQGDTADKTVTVTYDGYGTLIMPNGSYHDVVRVRETTATGNNYIWYNPDPLLPLLSINDNNNAYMHIAISPATIQKLTANKSTSTVHPNPATGEVTFTLTNKWRGANLFIFDITGKLLQEETVHGQSIAIDVSTYRRGMYMYKISHEGKTSTGKFNIQ